MLTSTTSCNFQAVFFAPFPFQQYFVFLLEYFQRLVYATVSPVADLCLCQSLVIAMAGVDGVNLNKGKLLEKSHKQMMQKPFLPISLDF
jgi:hypothetical protein